MASGLLDQSRRGERSRDRPARLIPPSGGSSTWARLRRSPSFWLGFGGIALLVLAAIAAPLLAPADPIYQFRFRDGGLTAAGDPVGPSARFPLGTDWLGRDYLSRLLYGARASLAVGLAATLAALVIGVAVGLVAAFAGTPRIAVTIPLTRRRLSVPVPIESTLMRLTDAMLALPAILLALALVAVTGPSLALTVGIVAAFMWTPTARIVYSQVRSLRARQFVEAAQAIGVSPGRVALRHVLPHVAPVVITYVPLGIAAAVLFEATLSYLGVGVPPPAPSWGSMIAEHFSFYASDPRLLVLPGAALVATVLSFNLVGDALRDALDPRLRAR